MKEETKKLIDFYCHPERGDRKETVRAGCRRYSATLITHRSSPPGREEVWVIFDGPNLGNVVTVEHCRDRQEADQLVQDFARGVHQDRRCRCGHTGRD